MNKKLQVIFLIFVLVNILLSLNDFIKQKFNKKNKPKLNLIYTLNISIFVSMLVYIFFECKDELIVDNNIAEF